VALEVIAMMPFEMETTILINRDATDMQQMPHNFYKVTTKGTKLWLSKE